jgi:hypothetical protein
VVAERRTRNDCIKAAIRMKEEERSDRRKHRKIAVYFGEETYERRNPQNSRVRDLQRHHQIKLGSALRRIISDDGFRGYDGIVEQVYLLLES